MFLLRVALGERAVAEAYENCVAKRKSQFNVHYTTWRLIISLCGETLPLKQESLHLRHPKLSRSALENRELEAKRITGFTAVLKDGKT